MEKKIYQAHIEFKEEGEGGQEGEFEAVFSRLGVVDKDTDITLPGAFEDMSAVIIEPWNHDYSLPVGKAVIRADEEKAWVEGRFLTETQAGREHYKTVKALGELTEWSYTFRVIKSGEETRDGERVRILEKLDVIGVGPVTRGAGIGTYTRAIKSQADEQLGLEGPVGGDDAAGDGEADNGNGKPSAELMAQINVAEIEMIVLENEV